MSAENYKYIIDYIYEKSGITIDETRTHFIEHRIGQLLRELKLDNLDELVTKIKSEVFEGEFKRKLLNSMTTNETSFFRDCTPFDVMKEKLLPQLATSDKIDIWCAACSSGQEVYSLLILIKEYFPYLTDRVKLLATDIDSDILKVAEEATYTEFELKRGMPDHLKAKYFVEKDGKFQVRDDIRNMVSFKKHNLKDEYLSHGEFDFVFCRNVLIYFDRELKTQILDKLARRMKDQSFLFLGGAESPLGYTDTFEKCDFEYPVYKVKKDNKGEL